MIPFFLLAGAFGILAILFILIIGRNAERGLKLEQADQTLADLSAQLAQALDQQKKLTERVEHLEAIVTSEAWDAFQANQDILSEEDPSQTKSSQRLRS